MTVCSICGKPAIAYVPYQKRYYCREHYATFIEDKVKRTIEKYKMIRKGDRILAAVSGGKDSVTLLSTLNKLRLEKDFELVALHVDLGIGEYSRRSRVIVEKIASMMRVPLIIFDVKRELGYSIPEIALKLKRPPCSICGTVKRWLYNAFAIEYKAKIATGHNADDIIAYALKNFIFQNLEAIRKLAPIEEEINGLAASKIKPLYTIYEKESLLYVTSKELPYNNRKCPYTRLDSLEFQLKELINRLEESRPSLKLGLLSKLSARITSYPESKEPIKTCKYCGLISSTGKCAFCNITEKLHGKALGGEIRSRIRDLLFRVS